MVRTAATAVRSSGGKSAKAAAKSSGRVAVNTSSRASSSNKRSSSVGNPLVQRPTPKWQKTISTFFSKNEILETDKMTNKEKEAPHDLNICEATSSTVNESDDNNESLPLETPEWQKPITTFFNTEEGTSESNKENCGENKNPTAIDLNGKSGSTAHKNDVPCSSKNDDEPSTSASEVKEKNKSENAIKEISENNSNLIKETSSSPKRQKISYKQLEEFENI